MGSSDDSNSTDRIVAILPAGLEEDRSKFQIAVEIIFLLLIWVLGIIGNVLVCIVIQRSRRVQSTTNYFVASIALSDLILAFSGMPMVAGRVISDSWPFGDFMCRLVRFIQFFSPNVTMFILTAISIDRFYTIIYPLSFKITRGTAKRMIACCWVFACLFSCLCFYFYTEKTVKSENGSNKTICPTYALPADWSGIAYTLSLFLIQYFAPMIIMLVVYTRLFRYIWKTDKPMRRIQRTMNSVPRTKVKMVKMLMVLSIITTLLLAPMYIQQLWFCILMPPFASPTIFIFCLWVCFSSSLAKPVIYMCCNSNFRRGCKEVFCMSAMRCYRSNTYAITNASTFGRKNHVGVMDTADNITIDSPSKTFNRSVHIDRSAWPVSHATPTTYV